MNKKKIKASILIDNFLAEERYRQEFSCTSVGSKMNALHLGDQIDQGLHGLTFLERQQEERIMSCADLPHVLIVSVDFEFPCRSSLSNDLLFFAKGIEIKTLFSS